MASNNFVGFRQDFGLALKTSTLLQGIAFFGFLFVLPIIFIFLKGIYNVFFHPLRKYPGPLLARASSLWYAWNVWHGTIAQALKKAHREYGEVVRVSPTHLTYTSYQAWKDIYGHRSGQSENFKAPEVLPGEEDAMHGSILTAAREKHSQVRRLLSNAFSEKALREQQPVIQRYVDLLIQRLHENCGDGTKPVNILDWYNFTTFDIIGELAFSDSFSCLSDSGYHPWVRLQFDSLKFGAMSAAIKHVGLNVSWLIRTLVPGELLDKLRESNELVANKLAHRKAASVGYTDFMGKMIEAADEGKIEEKDLLSNSRVLILAGSETTATLLTGVTYLLGANPAALQRLTEEIRSKFASEEQITFEAVTGMPYLLACLDEAFRLYPPVATPLSRQTPPQGANVCGEWIPGGVLVATHSLAIGNSAQNFADPQKYIPERWLKHNNGEKVLSRYKDDKKEAMQPFSFGPRNCIGRNLAYVEMRIILAKVLWNFDLELCEGNEDPRKAKVFALWDKGPLMVKLKPVKK